jgi:hypothetical protein
MTLTLQDTAASMRADFANLEHFNDGLLSKTSSIRAAVLAARSAGLVAPHTGQEILMRLHRAEEHAIRAQNEIFRAHDAAARTGRAVMGPEEPFTPSSPIGLIEATMAAEAVEDVTPIRAAA